jgi:hypothetical protein
MKTGKAFYFEADSGPFGTELGPVTLRRLPAAVDVCEERPAAALAFLASAGLSASFFRLKSRIILAM